VPDVHDLLGALDHHVLRFRSQVASVAVGMNDAVEDEEARLTLERLGLDDPAGEFAGLAL
jgi:hypothetical protein